jgi:hypothetical protein
MKCALLLLLLAFLPGTAFAAAPPNACTEAQPVDVPCRGLLVPEADARRALTCLRVELPDCREQAALAAQDASAEFQACKAVLEVERLRGDKLAALVDEATTPPAPALAWWQSAEWVVAISVVAVGALTAAIILGVD